MIRFLTLAGAIVFTGAAFFHDVSLGQEATSPPSRPAVSGIHAIRALCARAREERMTTINALRSVLEGCLPVILIRVDEDSQEAVRLIVEDSRKAVRLAARTLGEMRAAEAVPELTRLLGVPLSAVEPSVGSLRASHHTPLGVLALIKIGQPASEAMVELICESPVSYYEIPDGARVDEHRDALRVACAFDVLQQIEGREAAAAILQRRLAGTADENARKNLRAALDYFEVESSAEVRPSVASVLRSPKVSPAPPSQAPTPVPPAARAPSLSATFIIGITLAALLLGFGAAALIFRRRSTSSRP